MAKATISAAQLAPLSLHRGNLSAEAQPDAFHPSNGYLTSIEEVLSGTGRFAGATGFLYNNATDVNSVFYSNISGQLCLAKDHGQR
jgi:hypothetical protein